METDANYKSVLFSTFPFKENGNDLATMYYVLLMYPVLKMKGTNWMLESYPVQTSADFPHNQTLSKLSAANEQTAANLITKTFLNLTRKEMKNVIFDQFSLNSILTMIFAIPFELYQIPKCSEI